MGGSGLQEGRPQEVFTLNHEIGYELYVYEPIAILMYNVQSTYQHKILYHIEVLMQRTKFSFYWTCTVTHHLNCVCSDIEI